MYYKEGLNDFDFLDELEKLIKDENAFETKETTEIDPPMNGLLAEAGGGPGTQPGEIEGIRSDNSGDSSNKKSQAAQIVELVDTLGITFFHSPEKAGYASIPLGAHRENHLIRSVEFEELIIKAYYEATGNGPTKNCLGQAIGIFDMRARFEGECHEVYLRLAPFAEEIFLDLGTNDWSAVRICKEGWEVVHDAPVKFVRSHTMQPLPMPVPGGTITELQEVLNLNPEDWPLIAGWMVGTLNPYGAYTTLILFGEQGSAKSTTAKMIKGLIDPSIAPLRAEPKSNRDLLIGAKHGWIPAFDNVSYISADLSDGLCRLATGGGFGTKKNYSDDQEAIIEAKRPVIMTGIGELATRGDLVDRSILIQLPTISMERRQPEQEVVAKYEGMKGRVLGGLLDGVVSALRNQERVGTKLKGKLPRMADFIIWATAAEEGLGLKVGSCYTAYMENRKAANVMALEASPLAVAIQELLKAHGGGWSGTVSELHMVLLLQTGADGPKRIGLPHSSRTLADTLRRMAPNLRGIGINCTEVRTNASRLWRLSKD